MANGDDAGPAPADAGGDAEPVDPALAELSQEIRRRRHEAGLSHNQLAARTGYARQYVSVVERPKKSGVPSRHLIAAIDRALDAGGALVALHERAAQARDERRAIATRTIRPAAPHTAADMTAVTVATGRQGWAPGPVDLYDGLDCSSALNTTVLTLARLSGWEMDRRQFLAGATFAAASFAEPALTALTAQPAAEVASTAGRRVGMADVEVIVESVSHLRRLDHRYGSGRVRDQAIHLLNIGASAIGEGSYSDKVGRALVGAVAQTSWLAGSTSSDVGQHPLAQRYYIHTLNLAVNAGNRLYAANVLSHMSRLTVQMGNASHDAGDQLRHARQAISFARAGKMVADGGATPILSALLDAVEARGHALIGQFSEARAAVLSAESHYERARLSEEPEWLNFYTEAELAADLGRCLRDVGEHEQATRLITQALESYEPWRVRSRCFVQADLAATHLVGGDHDHAAALGHDAVTTAAQVSSSRTLDRLRTLQRQFRLTSPSPQSFGDLDSRIFEFLASDTSAPREGSATT